MKCTKIYNARAQLLCFSLNLFVWWRFRRRGLLNKLPYKRFVTRMKMCRKNTSIMDWPNMANFKGAFLIVRRLGACSRLMLNKTKGRRGLEE